MVKKNILTLISGKVPADSSADGSADTSADLFGDILLMPLEHLRTVYTVVE